MCAELAPLQAAATTCYSPHGGRLAERGSKLEEVVEAGAEARVGGVECRLARVEAGLLVGRALRGRIRQAEVSPVNTT